jgi:hypothetical protein
MFQKSRSLNLNLQSNYGEIMEKHANFSKNISHLGELVASEQLTVDS